MHRNSRLFVVSLLASAVLAGCGGSDSNKKTTTGTPGGTSTTLVAKPSLGKVFNAAVEARCAATGTTLASGTTGASGVISLTATGSCTGPVIVEVLASATTTYFDEQANAIVSMPAGTQLRALLPSLTAASVNIAVTPLTEIAFRQALHNAGNAENAITSAQATTANTAVTAQVFGSTATALDILQPPTLWDASTTAGSLGNTNADRYAYYLAALAGMGGTAAAPAVAITEALAGDLADGTLNGVTSTDITYTSTDFSGKLDTELGDFAAYASTDLQTELGIDNNPDPEPGANDFPNETITLPATTTTLLQAADIAGAVGTYTGTSAAVIQNGSTTTFNSCTVEVAANGSITVSSNGESITQRVDAGNGDASVVSLSNADTWTLTAGGAPGTDVNWVNLNIDRNKMIDAHAYTVANTSSIPTVFTKEIKCWMPINRVKTAADNDWNSRSSSATASDFPSVMAGTYNGTLFSDNGVLAPTGSTCTLVVGNDGSLDFSTGGAVATPVSISTQIAGDEDDRAAFTDDTNWLLQGRDIVNAAGNGYDNVYLQSVGGSLLVNGSRKLANENTAAGWACNDITKAEAVQ